MIPHIAMAGVSRRIGSPGNSMRPRRGRWVLWLVGLGFALVSGCDTVTPPDPSTVTLTVSIAAADGASGTVVSSPTGIYVTSGSRSAVFTIDTAVTLAATAGVGSVFVGFTPAGLCAPGTSATTCELQLESSTSVQAMFQPGTTFHQSLDVVAASPVAGAYLEFTLPVGVLVASVSPLRDGVSARAATVGDTVRLTWVAEEARGGEQVRVVFGTYGGIEGTPEVVSALVLADHDGPDLGASTVSFVSSSAAAVSTTPLIVDPVAHGADGTLLASFADHPLGDLNGDGALSVRDALWLLERSINGAWTDFQRYHADLDADDVTDAADLERLLAKLVDPELPARLHVKPSSVSFVQLDPATNEDAVVLVANGGRLPLTGLDWTPPEGVEVAHLGGIAGQSAGLRLSLPAAARRGWLPGFFSVEHASVVADVRVGNLVFLVAGQSNAVGWGTPLDGWPETPHASVRMLGNDYVWRDASEPLDDATGQRDWISDDGVNVFYSFGTRFGNLIHDATGFPTYLIPAAKGNTSSADWKPKTDLLDRANSLFGSANYRAQVSAGLNPNLELSQPFPAEGGPVSAVLWYQGEADRFTDNSRQRFVDNTPAIVDAFAAELGVPTIAVQLASHCNSGDNMALHAVAELQRRFETRWGEDALAGFHLVVAFDLPRSDCIHLSAVGQRVLAERIDLAVREHVLGEAVDGTGPRLLSLSHSGHVVTLRTTLDLVPGEVNEGLFTVWDGPPTSNPIGVAEAEVSSGDPTVVTIRLSEPISSGGVANVRYMARHNAEPGPTIRAAEGELPLPAFGPLAAPFDEP